MARSLVVVESPAKAKTINKYLGKDFTVLASYGHVRDLLPKEGAVETDNGFKMNYRVIEKNQRHVDAIVSALKGADSLYLATDPDREGEAIAWHLLALLEQKKKLKNVEVKRVVFHEITKRAVNDAIENAGDVSLPLVNAQQARRALDYLVGFNISPLLWKKVRPGLSAGRVQSPALRLIVDRENEIEQFVRREYWTIEGIVSKDENPFDVKLIELDGSKLEQFDIDNEAQATEIVSRIETQANGVLTITDVAKKSKRRNPHPPYTTSTLQQDASNKLGFTAQRTMRTAQQLYEGIELGSGTEGLITYMRTDSVTLSQEAVEDIRSFVQNTLGNELVPNKPRAFKTKSKSAQEAHEAIRPTSVKYTPIEMAKHLSADQLKLYELIWKRTVACQMIHATYDTVTVTLAGGASDIFRASGSTLVKPGFLQVYGDVSADNDSKEKSQALPVLTTGDIVTVESMAGNQHFTEPPPRFTEASLIKTLEEFGIGRPSTYASIISTLQQRGYAELVKKRFFPTDVGRVVSRFLKEHFVNYVDYDFTARLEDSLDTIARGEAEYVPILEAFWEPFHKLVEEKEKSVSRKDVTQQVIDEKCPECGNPLSIRLGKRGNFIGCTAFPDCSYTRSVDGEEQNTEPEVVPDRKCPECQSDLIIRSGKYGKFIGCSGYPNCKHIEPIDKPKDTGVQCPQCHQANLLERKSRRGKVFFSCARYPDCTYAVWNQPVDEKCPSCQHDILTIKTTKRHGRQKVCPQADCTFIEDLADSDSAEQEAASA